MKNWQREQLPRRWRRKGGEDDGGGIKRDFERVGEEWRKRSTDRMNWGLLIENVMTEK